MNSKSILYKCWLNFRNCMTNKTREGYIRYCKNIFAKEDNAVIQTAVTELKYALEEIFDTEVCIHKNRPKGPHIFVGTVAKARDEGYEIEADLKREGFCVKNVTENNDDFILIAGNDNSGVLYGIFYFIRSISIGKAIQEISAVDYPRNQLRIINHWDNISGKIERGYAGDSIFYKNNRIVEDTTRVKDYARLLASVGINGIVINNVNVHELETRFITEEYLPDIARLADIFRSYGIKTYLSINFAAPIEIGQLDTADPLEPKVREWWKKRADIIYSYIPDFGGFLVKADSEFRPGPHSYGRDHAQGANMLAEALKPHGGIVIWRCFVYNCMMDWRDRSADRAKAAYENFKPLDGKFMDNVVLQVKNGPMDFQIREPVSPLLGAMENTNLMVEFQITQEYTGQQKHLCYLVPMWKETLDFDTYAKGEGSYVSRIVDGSLFNMKYSGIAAVSNIGDSECWTGHPLAQANLYGFGRLSWNPELTSKEIAEEWTILTFGPDRDIVETITSMLLESRQIYENYTAPLGVGWMVNPGHHYGPNVDGYEYSHWGTYHYADFKGIGVDRTAATGTGFTKQYREPVAQMYENIETCPDELLLFFHHVPYTHKLKSGKTVIQHIYDTHFEGVEQVELLIEKWNSLKGKIDHEFYNLVLERLKIQLRDAIEWRDVVNTYFYRKTGIKDAHGRKIYE